MLTYVMLTLVFLYFSSAGYELKKEARMCILQHDNIVAVFARVFEANHYGIVMEYVVNGTLEDFVFNYDV